MGLPETSLGVIPGYGGTQRLSNLIGKGRCLEMICTADIISAEEALKWGLVNHICDQKKLQETCEKVTQNTIIKIISIQITRKPPENYFSFDLQIAKTMFLSKVCV